MRWHSGGILLVVAFVLSGCFWASPNGVNPEKRTLESCPESPNCVSSLEDGDHSIEPYRYDVRTDEAKKWLLKTLSKQYDATVSVQTDTYVHATVTTTLGFVDDLEFRFDPDHQVIHVRSSSRVGHSDLGTNRERLEKLRESLEKLRELEDFS